jgi:hypothetical protein
MRNGGGFVYHLGIGLRVCVGSEKNDIRDYCTSLQNTGGVYNLEI